MNRHLAIKFFVAAGILGFASAAHAETAGGQAACAALKGKTLASTRIESTEWRSAGSETVPDATGAPQSYALPAHCLVRGIIGARTGVDGRAYGIRFELRLPQAWSRRFLFQGGSGLDGSVHPALGAVSSEGPTALARGYAVVSMDSGHEGPDATFAADQQARLDYAYAAIGETTPVAKALVARFYGAGPAHTYFVGCSNGGRQAMLAAERYPLAFDGVVAGDPGFHLSRAAVAEAWNVQKLAAIAPKNPDGSPRLADALSDADLKLVAQGVLHDCDGQDGLRDGMVNNIAACHFNPQRLQCPSGASAQCLTADKVSALQAVFSGPVDSRGDKLYPGFPYDAGVDQPGWRIWMLGFPRGPQAINITLGAASLSQYFMTPPQPDRAPTHLDIDRAAAEVAETGALNDPVSHFLTSFVGHGGKMIIYQGMSDPVFSASDIIHWYAELAADDPRVTDHARLFTIPGMNHCNGGPATDRFDVLAAIQAWVEDRTPPERIVATGAAFPGQSRPLCPYPSYARYRGGDTSKAESFMCASPSSDH